MSLETICQRCNRVYQPSAECIRAGAWQVCDHCRAELAPAGAPQTTTEPARRSRLVYDPVADRWAMVRDDAGEHTGKERA